MSSQKPHVVVPIREPKDTLGNVPSKENLRVYTLERELRHQRCEVSRHKDIIRTLKSTLQEQLDTWLLGLDHKEWPTIGQVYRFLNHIESALTYNGPTVNEPHFDPVKKSPVKNIHAQTSRRSSRLME